MTSLRLAAIAAVIGLLCSGCARDFIDEIKNPPAPASASVTDGVKQSDIKSTNSNDIMDVKLRNMTADLVDAICSISKDNNGHYTYNDLAKYGACAKRKVDDLCVKYFTYLDRLSSGSQFGRREINNITDYATALMGLTGTPAQQLAILSGTRVFVNNSWDAADELLMLSPAPFKVHRLVQTKQLKLFAEYRDAYTAHAAKNGEIADPVAIDMAFTFVANYAGYCTPIGIHKTVDEAVQEKVEGTSDDPTKNKKLAKALQDATDILNQGLPNAPKLQTISVDDAVQLSIALANENDAGAAGYLADHGLKEAVDALRAANKLSALKQVLGAAVNASPDLESRVADKRPAPPALTTKDLIKDAKFTLAFNAGTIKIGANDIANKDADGLVHYAYVDPTGTATGPERKETPENLLKLILARAK